MERECLEMLLSSCFKKSNCRSRPCSAGQASGLERRGACYKGFRSGLDQAFSPMQQDPMLCLQNLNLIQTHLSPSWTDTKMPGTIGHPDAAAADAISARLSSMHGLRLPAALLREQPFPESTAVKAHLTDLLQRDASVFLEVRGRGCPCHLEYKPQPPEQC